jgi:hypothetical protein
MQLVAGRTGQEYNQRKQRREVIEAAKGYHLREEATNYQALFEVENSDIGLDNTDLWNINDG